MARPTKLTPEIQKKIGDGVSLGLTYALAANSAGVTYQTFNSWYQKGKTEKAGNILSFHNTLTNTMQMPLNNFWNA
jgi:hypothetical protein